MERVVVQNPVPDSVTFQSLIGFKINWNFESGTDLIGYQMFQSLIGFKINWNQDRIDELKSDVVSIPNRV